MTIALHVDQNRDESKLGASEIPAVLGLDRYTSPLTIWRRKRGLPVNDDKPAYVQEAAEWGQVLEPVIRGRYALSVMRPIYVPDQSWVHPTLSWLRCTPDGLVFEPDGNEIRVTDEKPDCYPNGFSGLLQVKTCSAYKRDEWGDGVPPAHEVQVRVEMAVTGLPWCDVVCLVGGQQMRGPFRVERDPALEANIIRDASAFWERVQSGTEPDVDGSAAWREYASERMRPSKVAIIADDDTNALIANWVTARRQRKALLAIEEQHKTELLLKLAAAGATKIESRLGALSAYQTAGKGSWKDFAISLGGGKTLPDRFKGAPGKWTIRAPGDDDGE